MDNTKWYIDPFTPLDIKKHKSMNLIYLTNARIFGFSSTFLLLCLLCSCSSYTDIKEYSLDGIITENTKSLIKDEKSLTYIKKVNICDNIHFDSILVTKPYVDKDTVKQFAFSNFSSIQTLLDRQRLDESICCLFFIRNETYIGYSVIKRNVADFSTYYTNRNQQIQWITRKDCCHLVLRQHQIYNLITDKTQL